MPFAHAIPIHKPRKLYWEIIIYTIANDYVNLININLCTFVRPFSADLKRDAGSLGVADRESGETEQGKRLKYTEIRM